MPSLGDLIDEITGLVRTHMDLVSPAAGTHNILTSIQASQRSFVEEVKAGTVALPCAVIQIGDDEPETEFGVNSDLRRLPVAIHYMQEWGPNGNQRTVHAKLKTMRKAIDDQGNEFTNFFPVERGVIRTDVPSAVTSELFVASKATVIAGTVEWTPGFLVDDA